MKNDSIHYQLFPEVSRATKRKVQIIEAAIQNYATIGLDRTTNEKIATLSEISRPLINKYFKDKNEIFELSIHYIRINYQNYVVERLENTKTPKETLKTYIEASIEWSSAFPTHAKTWSLFYYQTTVNKKLKNLNTKLVQVGTERIVKILTTGIAAGEFKISKKEALKTARLIQFWITGAIVSRETEVSSKSEPNMTESVVQSTFKLVE